LIDYITNSLVFALTIAVNTLDPRIIIVGGNSLDPFLPQIQKKVEREIKEKTWMQGPRKIYWYPADKINAAYGTIIHSIDTILQKFIENDLA